jgi:type III restriction enzyme
VQDLFSDDEQRKNIVLMLAMNEVVGHILSNVREQNAEKIEIILDKERPIISTADMPLWLTSKLIWPVIKCHLTAFAMDSGWEASEAYSLDINPLVESWIKNDHLGFVVWYFEDGAPKRYYPDFVARLTNGAHVVIETKGQKDKSAQIKRKALQGWVKAVNSMGTWGKWFEVLSTHPSDLEGKLKEFTNI